MTEYWKSTKRYQCQVCRQWVPDHPTSKLVHERSDRHQQAMKSMLERATSLGPRPRSSIPPEVAPGLEKVDRNMAANVASSGTDLYKSLKEKYAQDHSHFSANQLENEFAGDSKWQMHWNKEAEKYFYFNRLTRRSQWQRPQNFDGYDPSQQEKSKVQNPEEELKEKKKYSTIGKWVDMDSPKTKLQQNLPQLPIIEKSIPEEKENPQKQEQISELPIMLNQTPDIQRDKEQIKENEKKKQQVSGSTSSLGEEKLTKVETQGEQKGLIKKKQGKTDDKAGEVRAETEKIKVKLKKQQIDSQFVRTMYEVEENKSSGRFKKRKGMNKMDKNYHNN